MAFRQIHFISGLPRSGSTLLAAILRQNPRFRASMSGPLADVYVSTMRAMTASETALFINDCQRKKILGSLVESFYFDCGEEVVFDTNRNWCSLLPSLCQLFPETRVICCVRNPAWILDSVERLVQTNAFQLSRMFGHEPGTVYSRVEAMMKSGFLGASLNALRQAWFGDHTSAMVAVRYESLVERPSHVIEQLYEILDEGHFEHNFKSVEYDAPEFDARFDMPGMHRVHGPVEAKGRKSLLPPDLFSQFDGGFWNQAGQNPNKVRIL